MEQAVQAAEVDERAVFGDVLDLALDDDALFEVLERLALLAVDHLFEDDLARENDVAAFLVNLQDPDFDLLVPEAVEVADRANVDLAAGQERLNAPDVDAEAAFYPIRHARDDVRALLVSLLDLLPRLHAHGVGARKLHVAFGVFELFDVDVDFIARVDRNLLAVLELADRDDALRFETDVDDDVLVGDLDDAAFDDLALADLAAVRLFVLGENLSEILHAELGVRVIAGGVDSRGPGVLNERRFENSGGSGGFRSGDFSSRRLCAFSDGEARGLIRFLSFARADRGLNRIAG